jgi:hypothetical protein
MKNPQKPKRKRAIPYIFGSDRLDEMLWRLLDDTDDRLRMYVYRMGETQKLIPAIYVGLPFSELCEWLRNKHSGGDFQVIIRRNKSMELSGIVCIGAPLTQRKR